MSRKRLKALQAEAEALALRLAKLESLVSQQSVKAAAKPKSAPVKKTSR